MISGNVNLKSHPIPDDWPNQTRSCSFTSLCMCHDAYDLYFSDTGMGYCRKESYTPADMDPLTGARLDKGLHGLEGPGNAKGSDGFFEKGLLKAMESEHNAGGSGREVKVVGNGHCHVTENCRRVKGVWLCFGGGGFVSPCVWRD